MSRATMCPRRSSRARRRGAASIEYIMLITLIGLPTMAGAIAGGTVLFASYEKLRTSLVQWGP